MGGLLERLESWVNEGTRSIKIEIDNFGGHVTRNVFVYDSETGEGKLLDSLDGLESIDFFQEWPKRCKTCGQVIKEQKGRLVIE